MVVFGHLRANQSSEQGANARGDLLSVRVELLLDEREVVSNHLGHRFPRLLGDAFHLLDQSLAQPQRQLPVHGHGLLPYNSHQPGAQARKVYAPRASTGGTITTRNGTGRSRRRTRFEDEGKRERAPNTVTEAHEEAEE
jgi:hypothetical protein